MTTNWNDKEYVLKAVKKNADALKYAPKHLQDDKDEVIAKAKGGQG